MQRLFFILSILLFAVSAAAQTSPSGKVTAHPPARSLSGEGGEDTGLFSEVIRREEIEGRRTSLPEILAQTPAVQIRRYGGLDDFATVSIRGSTAEQVDVYLNGLRLNRSEGGGLNLATIPLHEIERIEIYRGAAPARFGSSSIGGVVNLITRRASEKRETDLSASYGSFQTVTADLHHSQSLGKFSYGLGYGFARSAGDFSYLSDNGTPFNPDDDRTLTRENNGFTRHDVLLHGERQFENFQISLQDDFFREDRGVPGAGTVLADTAGLSTTRNGLRIELSSPDWLDPMRISIAPNFQYLKQQFTDLEGEVGLAFQDNDNDTFQYGTDLTAEATWGIQTITASASYRGEQFLPEDFTQTPSSAPASERNSGSFTLEDEIRFLSGRLVLNPQVRTEHIFDRFSDSSSTFHPVSGKIGVRVEPIRWLVLKTNLSRSYRPPDFSELFGDRGLIIGNTALRPEKGLNWDLGGIFQTNAWRWEAAYFLNHVDDLIQFLQTSQRTAQAQNLTAARIQGIETSLAVRPLPWLEFSGNYTFQHAVDTGGLPGTDGRKLPGRPAHEAHLQGSARNRWGKIFTQVDFLDDNFLDTQNTLRIDHRVLFASGVIFEPIKPITASFEVKNILNDRVADVVGFPLPGRSYYGKLSIKI